MKCEEGLPWQNDLVFVSKRFSTVSFLCLSYALSGVLFNPAFVFVALQIVVEREEREAQALAASTKAIADDAERDLSAALPALDAAVACLSKLRKVMRNAFGEVYVYSELLF